MWAVSRPPGLWPVAVSVGGFRCRVAECPLLCEVLGVRRAGRGGGSALPVPEASLHSPALGVSEAPAAQLPFASPAPLLQTHVWTFLPLRSLGPRRALQMQAALRRIGSQHLTPRALRGSVVSFLVSGELEFLLTLRFLSCLCVTARARFMARTGVAAAEIGTVIYFKGRGRPVVPGLWQWRDRALGSREQRGGQRVHPRSPPCPAVWSSCHQTVLFEEQTNYAYF